MGSPVPRHVFGDRGLTTVDAELDRIKIFYIVTRDWEGVANFPRCRRHYRKAMNGPRHKKYSVQIWI